MKPKGAAIIGVLVLATVGTYGALAYFEMAPSPNPIQPAEAQVQLQAETTEEVYGESSSGLVESIMVSADGEVTWEDMDQDVQYVVVTVSVGSPEQTEALAQRNFTDIDGGTSGSLTFSNVSGELFANSAWEPDDFNVESDGGEQTTDVPVYVNVRIGQPTDGADVYAQEEHTLQVTINNVKDQNTSSTNPQTNISSSVSGQVIMEELNVEQG